MAVRSIAEYGDELTNVEQVLQALHQCREQNLTFTPVGQGSNIIASTHVAGFVGVIAIQGVELLGESQASVDVRVGAGEVWHPFVQRCLAQGWYGLENLSLIPGTVGAAPIQNIGAYGVEVSSFITAVEVLDREGVRQLFSADQCQFAYRTSLFRNNVDYVVTHVHMRLSRLPQVNTTYPGVAQMLEQMGCEMPTPENLAQAIVRIRQAKLPDPNEHPNSGSVFKNPVVSRAEAAKLAEQIDNLQQFELADDAGNVKLSAAQLIDSLGWKEKGTAQIACWHLQPLVIVNNGTEKGEDVLAFAQSIQRDVQTSLGVQLELEPIVL